MTIKYDSIDCGYIELKLLTGDYFYRLIFDELLNDPIPQLVNILLQIQQGNDCEEDFEEMHPDAKVFSISARHNGDEVSLRVTLYKPNLVFEENFHRAELVAMLKKIFADLLNDKYFPYSYPCFWQLGESHPDAVVDAVTDAIEEAHPDWNFGDVYNYAVANGQLELAPEYKIYLAKYKKMLTEYVIPKNWISKGK